MSARLLPVGGICYISGFWTATPAYTEYKVTPLPDWLWPCDGTQITDLTSPLVNKYTPNVASRYLRSQAGGTYGETEDLLIGSSPIESYDGIPENEDKYKRYELKAFMRIK